jgi:hypothetical protein
MLSEKSRALTLFYRIFCQKMREFTVIEALRNYIFGARGGSMQKARKNCIIYVFRPLFQVTIFFVLLTV